MPFQNNTDRYLCHSAAQRRHLLLPFKLLRSLQMLRREYDFYVYILASRSRQLYVGMTNSMERRLREHRECRPGTYCAKYNIHRLVYVEHSGYVLNAIARENELKDWNRSKKVRLIEGHNPTWEDLSERWDKVLEAGSSAALRNDKQGDNER